MKKGLKALPGRACERGTALVPAIVMVVAMVGMTGAYIALTLARSNEQALHVDQERLARVLDGAIGLELAALQRNTANTQMGGRTPTGVAWAVVAEPVSGAVQPTFKIGGYAQDGKVTKRALVVVRQEVDPLEAGMRGGVVTYAQTDLSGSITVDGNDVYPDGTDNPLGLDVFGISSVSGVSLKGSAKAGGNGRPPSGSPNQYNVEQNATWGDGTDANGNGVIDPNERRFPLSPDEVVNLSLGSLKQMAQASGTYFATEAAWTDYVDEHSDQLPGGKVFYLDFKSSNFNIDFPDEMNDEPSIFVNHKVDNPYDANNDDVVDSGLDPKGASELGNIHGSFRGLMIVDGVKHFNGGFHIIGGIVSLAGQQYGNVFGNGNALIQYSSAVLNDLPDVARQGSPFEIIAWTSEGSDLLAAPVTTALGLVNQIVSQTQTQTQ